MDLVTGRELAAGVEVAELAGAPVCVHAALSSFGRVQGGADAVVDALLAAGCTVLVPAFSGSFAVGPPPGMRPARNGCDYARMTAGSHARVFRPDGNEIDAGMGAVPRAVLSRPGRARGAHALCSFAALGPLARSLVDGQTGVDVYAPLRALGDAGGAVALMGVGLTRMTLLHLAEEASGRMLFRRWANGPDGRVVPVAYGSCSEGFERLSDALRPIERRVSVGRSVWRVFPAAQAVTLAATAMAAEPSITSCGHPDCRRCADSIAGGPLL